MIAYKLVPVEPTQEMIDAALKSDHEEISPRKIVEQDYKAMLAAVPEVQVAGWQFYQDGKWWYGDDRIKVHRKNTEEAGIPVRDVYASPQPTEQKSTACVGCEGAPASGNSPCAVCGQKSALDVSALVDALDLMVTTHDEGGWPTATIMIARAALVTYRKQGGEA